MKPDRWLIVPVEVQVRELLARLLVAAIAADRGYKVLIGQDRVIRRLARFLPRGILFDKSLGAAGDRKVRRYAALGYTITAIDEESTGFYPNPDMYLATRLSEDSLCRAHHWYCISDRMRDLATERYPKFADRFITTGLPRTDIWRKQFHRLYEAPRDKIRGKHGRFILFNSNFGTIIHAREVEFVENQLRKDRIAYAGADEYRARVSNQGRQNLDAFVAMLPKVRAWFPGHKVIIRPHPSENRDFWHEVASRTEGVVVEDNGLATAYILASDCLIHHGCTTGIEAELLGKAHVMYAPFRDDHHDTEVMKTFAPIVNNEENLRSTISRLLANQHQDTRSNSEFQVWYASLVGPLVSERIVDTFDNIELSQSGNLPYYLPALQFMPRQLSARYLPQSARSIAYSRQKWQGTSIDEVRAKLDIISAGSKIQNRIQAREVFPQLYLLESE